MVTERVLRSSAIGGIGAASTLIVPTVCIFDGTESLRLEAASSISGVTLTAYLRVRRADGSVEPMVFTLTPTSDRQATTRDYSIGDGVLLNLMITATAGAPLWGQVFVTAFIIRGDSGATLPQAVLARAYVTALQPIAWPGTPLQSSVDGPGATTVVFLTDPPAGSGIVITVPTRARWRITSLAFQYNTSAVAGNRNIFVAVYGPLPGELIAQCVADAAQGPAVTGQYSAYPGANSRAALVQGVGQIQLPSPLVMAGGWLLSVGAYGGNIGDDFVGPVLAYEEWLEVA